MSFNKVFISSSCDRNSLDLLDATSFFGITSENQTNYFLQSSSLDANNVGYSGRPISLFSNLIQDTSVSSYKLWSSNKVDSEITDIKNWATTEINNITNSVSDNTIFMKNDNPTDATTRVISTRMPHDVIKNVSEVDVEFTLINGNYEINTTNVSEDVDLRNILNEGGYVEIDDGTTQYRGLCSNIDERKFDFSNSGAGANWNSVSDAKIYVVKKSIEFVFGDSIPEQSELYNKARIRNDDNKTYFEAIAKVSEDHILELCGYNGAALSILNLRADTSYVFGDLTVSGILTLNNKSFFNNQATFSNVKIEGSILGTINMNDNNLSNVKEINGANLSLGSHLNASGMSIYDDITPFAYHLRSFDLGNAVSQNSTFIPIQYGSYGVIDLINALDINSFSLDIDEIPSDSNFRINIVNQSTTDPYGIKCFNFGSQAYKKGLYRIDVSISERFTTSYNSFKFIIKEFNYDEGPLGTSSKTLAIDAFRLNGGTDPHLELQRSLEAFYNYIPNSNKRVAILLFAENASELNLMQLKISINRI